MLSVLLRELTDRLQPGGHVGEHLRMITEAQWERVTVHREFFLIDVVVEITSAQGAAVIGIENKIDAGEQPQQIARYQEALLRAFPGRTARVMAFLTPTGREPTTARSDSAVSAVAISYDSVLSGVKEALGEAPSGSRDEHVLSEVAAHLEEDILGDPEVKAMVGELWRSHRRALGLALRYRPRLSDIRDLYVGLLRERFGADVDIYYYPERRRDLREIKMDLSSWHEKGFPFTFMLYANKGGRPRVRVLIWRDNYKEHAESLGAWARRVNALAGPPYIDENFTPLNGWNVWHRVFDEEDYPPPILDEVVFDENTAVAAVDAIAAFVEQLRPYVESERFSGNTT